MDSNNTDQNTNNYTNRNNKHIDENLKTNMNIENYHNNINNDSCRCNKCGKSYKKNGLCFEKHLKQCNLNNDGINKNSIFKCDNCNKTYKKNSKCWRKHIQQCREDKHNSYKIPIFKCNTCNKTYRKNGKNYQNHIRLCNTNNKADKVLDDEQILLPLSLYTEEKDETHEKINKKNKVYICQHCGTEYFNLQYYHKHKTNCEAKRFCNICSQLFSTTRDFHNHKRIHLSKKYACDKCGKKFKRSDCLQDHINAVHNKMVYTCNKCNKSNLSRSTWFRHRNVCGT